MMDYDDGMEPESVSVGGLATNLGMPMHVCAERTVMLIKPDAFASHHVGDILRAFEREGFGIVFLQRQEWDESRAAEFYAEHLGKPFFDRLVDFIISGPLIACVLERVDAVAKARELIGSTLPESWKDGTLRMAYGTSITRNAVHGSTTPEDACREIKLIWR